MHWHQHALRVCAGCMGGGEGAVSCFWFGWKQHAGFKRKLKIKERGLGKTSMGSRACTPDNNGLSAGKPGRTDTVLYISLPEKPGISSHSCTLGKTSGIPGATKKEVAGREKESGRAQAVCLRGETDANQLSAVTWIGNWL